MSTTNETNGAASHGEEKPLLAVPRPQQALTLEDVERHSRQRLCLALSLFCCACILVGGIGLWHLHTTLARDTAHYYTDLATHALENIADHSDLPDHCETTLLLFRHCEKDGDEGGTQLCNYLGYERAAYIATLFGGPQARWPMPSHLFALTPERNGNLNYREYETLLPLSRKAKIDIDLARHPELAKEYLDLLASGALCDQVTVVSWKHSFLVELAARLGCGPDRGCPSLYNEHEFDQLWQLQYVFRPPSSSSSSSEFSQQDSFEDSVDGTRRHRRRLKGKKHRRRNRRRNIKHPNRKWAVYGSVSQMNFDPLSFGYQAGDYQGNGSGHWKSQP